MEIIHPTSPKGFIGKSLPPPPPSPILKDEQSQRIQNGRQIHRKFSIIISQNSIYVMCLPYIELKIKIKEINFSLLHFELFKVFFEYCFVK